jgi:uncharacterized protein YutE (UPF0331/DUF86 family)
LTKGKLRAELLAERAARVRDMLTGLRAIPLESLEAFTSDPRNSASAESYLRRALEGMLDLGRHVLAKGFGRAAIEYKEIADGLAEVGVLDEASRLRLREMAGYRNRMVHFYDEITREELFQICSEELGDIEATIESILGWIARHPELVEGSPKEGGGSRD